MFIRFRLSLSVLALAAPAALAAQSAQDFQLPPNPAPSASPRVQGPVDTEAAVPVRPRVIATPTPTPIPSQRQVETVQPQPGPVPSTSAATAPPARPAAQPTATPRPLPRGLPTDEARLPLDPGAPTPIVPAPLPDDAPGEATRAEPVAAPSVPLYEREPDVPVTGEETAARGWLLPALGAGFVVLLLIGAGLFWSRRRSAAPPPQIERPVVAAGNGFAAPHEIQISAEAIKLTRSVMNATLHYRVSLINRASHALSDVAFGADIVSAHGGVPVEEQVATPSTKLETRHSFARIAPGQTVRHEGQIVIPLSQARIIRQGKAALFVPLLRVRLDGASEEPLVKTFVVGLGLPNGGRVMPFRIDEGPRSYQPIAARALD